MSDEGQSPDHDDLHVYVIPPIGHWYGWKNLAKVPADAMFPTEGAFSFTSEGKRKDWRAEVDRLLFQGRKWAEANLGYRGDIARGPFLSMIPGHGTMIPLVAWESSERDLIFVASPVPLPHLEEMKAAAVEWRSKEPDDEQENAFERLYRKGEE